MIRWLDLGTVLTVYYFFYDLIARFRNCCESVVFFVRFDG